ncbi:I78 family peptidase inhibitor [Sphingomonas sp. M1-B02]|uniref:I78 family peptidase inhibitor n=1 Tax=Sphingomonas sp. M1-B02 TaxID=3114300 RepID=UPI00223FE657|nr:I78 family peptidase inhibitor [Sphingomonas sp. S6-11]UZK66914.1 I78 family peptidase inhibitor [Sphingomonas sp. S6-11]
MIRFTLPLIALAAAGCTYGDRPQVPVPVTGKCANEGLGALIGKTRSEQVASEALRLSGATTLRWISPGMMVTKDYREERLNLNLDDNGKIASTSCG